MKLRPRKVSPLGSGAHRPALERNREHDRGVGCHARLLAEPAYQLLQLPGGPGPHLEDVVGLAGHREAVLHLRELAYTIRQVVRLAGGEGAIPATADCPPRAASLPSSPSSSSRSPWRRSHRMSGRHGPPGREDGRAPRFEPIPKAGGGMRWLTWPDPA